MRLATLALALCGCGALSLAPLARAPRSALVFDPTQCTALDTDQTVWTIVTATSGALAGAGGVSAVVTSSTPRYVVTGLGVAFTVLAATGGGLINLYSQRYTRSCTSSP